LGTVNLVVCLVAGRIAELFAVRWGGAGLVGVEAPSYKGFRFPAEIIGHGVWLYHRFLLSFCEVEEMMLQRGIIVSHETIRQWCAKFGQTYANALWRAPGPSGGYMAPR
jgi:putative transposase